MEPIASVSPALSTSIMASLFRITEASPEVKMKIGDQPVEARVDVEMEVRADDQPIEEGGIGPEEGQGPMANLSSRCPRPCKALLKYL